MESNNAYLKKSIFFTARKSRLRSTVGSAGAASSSDPASYSCRYYSARIHTMMERTSELDMGKEDAEIEASRDHWTLVQPEYRTAATRAAMDSSSSESESVSCVDVMTESERLKLYEDNVEVIRRLQRDNPLSRFFQIGDDGVVLGRKIAEGGQAEIYEVVSKHTKDWDVFGTEFPLVVKVFKAGYSLFDLQKQWPLALLHKFAPYNNDEWVGPETRFFNPVLRGRLLGDGRFAFEMFRWWGDLRKLLDVRMQLNGNRHPPFMMSDGNYHECCMLHMMLQIARGMKGLHAAGILHRDLKASNVLIESDDFDGTKERRLDPAQWEHNFYCFVADFECSIGVVGTGYWRAPEILEALKNRTMTPNLCTPKSDVYSYAMTCYEILTGLMPFEDIGGITSDDVLQGRRPLLSSHLRPWMKKLLNKCWHMDPFERPTFREIVNILKDIASNHPLCQRCSIFFNFHDYSY